MQKNKKETYSQVMNVNRNPCTNVNHIGYFKKGTRNHNEALINRNKIIEDLLNLGSFTENGSLILDSGCGAGDTSIYLAKKYPYINFLGVDISLDGICLADKFAQQHNVGLNTEFVLGDYLELGMIDNSLDGIFALQSITRIKDKKRFLREAHRVLKPNKKLVIDDVFLIKKPSYYLTQLTYDAFCKAWNVSSVMILEDFKNYLKELGFDEIKEIDVTKNSYLSFLIMGIKWFAFAISLRKKRIKVKTENKINIKKFPFSKNLFVYFIIRFLSPIIPILNRNLRMMIITAVKKNKRR